MLPSSRPAVSVLQHPAFPFLHRLFLMLSISALSDCFRVVNEVVFSGTCSGPKVRMKKWSCTYSTGAK